MRDARTEFTSDDLGRVIKMQGDSMRKAAGRSFTRDVPIRAAVDSNRFDTHKSDDFMSEKRHKGQD